ncbi:hypothetical protein U8335_04370 [Roseiconus lacunae]|nr:hypothetical protein U8335_04370 [Stieleria sp. HD01]
MNQSALNRPVKDLTTDTDPPSDSVSVEVGPWFVTSASATAFCVANVAIREKPATENFCGVLRDCCSVTAPFKVAVQIADRLVPFVNGRGLRILIGSQEPFRQILKRQRDRGAASAGLSLAFLDNSLAR